jgi:molecular chaperone GrpE (heat shock protein)
VADQLAQFQHACRDAARRLGLVPFAPNPGDAYDAKAHQLMDEKVKPVENDVVGGVIAPGYTYQGHLVRPPVVVLERAQAAPASPAEPQLL